MICEFEIKQKIYNRGGYEIEKLLYPAGIAGFNFADY
jgi:hypothetical protein